MELDETQCKEQRIEPGSLFTITAVLAAVVIGLGMFFKKRYVLQETEERIGENGRNVQDEGQR